MSDTGSHERHYAYPLVTWGSTLLGSVVALITAFMLNVLGAALGIAVVAIGQSSSAAAGAGILGLAWIVVANLVALGFGAWVAGRSTANPDHHGGSLQGIAVWAVTSCAILFLAGSALSGAGNGMMASFGLAQQSSAAAQNPSTNPPVQLDAPNAATSRQDAAALHDAAVKTAGATATAAFGAFIAMALGLVAAIMGARAGARHPGWTDRPRFTYVERRH